MEQAIKQIEKSQRIIIVCGAGISVACGIPDFRSPKTGLYNQLASYNLPEPTAMFSIDYFILRPHPFYTLTQHIFPDSVFKPSYTHCFFKLLQEKNKLHYLVTQNIDTIENTVGIKKEILSQAHGSYLSGIYCIGCNYTTDNHLMLKSVSLDGAVPHCPNCGRLLKPNIVFFGENLPRECMYYSDKIHESDLMMILGTSLNVGPVNQLPVIALGYLKDRILVNNVVVGDFIEIQKDREVNDTVLLGQCDDVVKNLAKGLKWDQELETIYKQYQEYKLPEQPKPSGDLSLIGLEDSLIVPDSKVQRINGKTIMLALANSEQIAYLKQNTAERLEAIKASDVDKLFSLQNVPNQIPIFGKIVTIQEKIVYSPLQGHFASYITKYVRCVKVGNETNVWDLITRYNGTNTQEKSQLVRQIDSSQLNSRIDLCYVNYQCLQHFINGGGNEENVEVESLMQDTQYILYSIKFQLRNLGIEKKIESPKIQIKLQFDSDDKEEISQKLTDKKNILLDQIKDVTRLTPLDISLDEKILTISFGKQIPSGGPEILKSVIESFWSKWSVKVAKK